MWKIDFDYRHRIIISMKKDLAKNNNEVSVMLNKSTFRTKAYQLWKTCLKCYRCSEALNENIYRFLNSIFFTMIFKLIVNTKGKVFGIISSLC